MDAHRIGAASGALTLNAALIALALGAFASVPDTQPTPRPISVVLLAAAELAPPSATPPAATPPSATPPAAERVAATPVAAKPAAAAPKVPSAPEAMMPVTVPPAHRAPAAAPLARSAPPPAPRVALAPPALSPPPAPAPLALKTPSPTTMPPPAARPGPGPSGMDGAAFAENRSMPPASMAPSATQPTEARRTAPIIDADWRGNPRPPYPELAQRLGEQGEVRIDVFVGTEGRVLDVRLTQSSGSPALDETALRTVRRWRFLPATIDGKPIAQWYHDWQWVFRLDT